MFKHINRVRVYHFCGWIPFFDYKEPFDTVELYKEEQKKPETAWERIHKLFQYTSTGFVSKEYTSVIQIASCAFAVGFGAAFISGGLQNFQKFQETNQHTRFISTYEMRRKINDDMMLGGFKTGCKYGIKIGVFTLVMGFGIIFTQAIRDKDGILEYVIGAGVAGAVSRMFLGIKASFVGMILGSTLGFIGGSLIYLGSKLTNTSFDDSKQWLYDIRVKSEERKREALAINKDNVIVQKLRFLGDTKESADNILNITNDSNSKTEQAFSENNVQNKDSENIITLKSAVENVSVSSQEEKNKPK